MKMNQRIGKFFSSLFLFVAESQAGLADIRLKKLRQNPDRVSELVLQNKRLREQLQLYKTINALLCRKARAQKISFSFVDKLKIIFTVKKYGLPTRRVREVLPLSPRTFRRWMRLLRSGLFALLPKSRKTHHARRTPKGIEALACRMKKENPAWGYVRISAELLKLGIERSPNTVKEILKRNGYVPEPDEEISVKNIETHQPHEMWVMDITTVRIFNLIPVYLFCVLDDFSRCVLSYAIAFRPSSQWVLGVLEKTAWSFGSPRRMLTDNGGQFLSDEFKKFVAQYNIRHVRSRPYHPQTNGKIERFFKSLKYELLNYYFITSVRQLNELVSEYVQYYNQYRPHQGIDNAIPVEKLEGKVKRLKAHYPADAVTRITFAGMLHAYLPRAA